MPRASRETEIYRRDAKKNHNLLTPAEREKLIAVSWQHELSWPVLTKFSHTSQHHLHDLRPD